MVVIEKPNPCGYGLKIAIREKAKRLPEYHLPVDIGNVTGRSDTGVPIPINTLGRWIFGVPGYAGNAIFEGGIDDKIVVWLPEEAPEEAIELIRKAAMAL